MPCKYMGCEGCTPSETCKGYKCKAYKSAKNKAWRAANPERVYELRKAWDKANPEKGAAMRKAYYEANKEKVLATCRVYYETHKEKITAINKAWAQSHKDKTLAANKKWKQANYVAVGDIRGLLRQNGEFIRTRSMSEAYFLSMLDDDGEEFETEVVLSTPIGRYIADVYLPRLNLFVEVKADHWERDDQSAKIEYLRKQGISIVYISSDLIDGDLGI